MSITIQNEREFWKNILINKLIFLKEKCPKYGLNSLKLNENFSIFNPLVNRCSSNKCPKIVFLKVNTFFALFPNTPVILIINILKVWLLDEKNGKEIYYLITEKFSDTSLSLKHVLEILEKARYSIAHYIKDNMNLKAYQRKEKMSFLQSMNLII